MSNIIALLKKRRVRRKLVTSEFTILGQLVQTPDNFRSLICFQDNVAKSVSPMHLSGTFRRFKDIVYFNIFQYPNQSIIIYYDLLVAISYIGQ